MTSFLQPYIQASAEIDLSGHNHKLTIQHSLDGLSIVIFDIDEQKFVSLKHYTYSEKNISLNVLLDELQEKENWKLEQFASVNFIVDNNGNTLVPSSYFQEEHKDKYLDILNLGKNKRMWQAASLQENSNSTRFDTLSSCEINNVYAVENDIEDYLSKTTLDIKLRHSSSVLIDNILKEFSERTQEMRVFVNVKNNSYELTIINKSELVFHNYFNFNTKEDFLYFILFTFEQLKIDNETTPLYFMGLIEEKSSIVELCSRYIRNIRFVKRNNDLNYAEELSSIPYYYHHILYNSALCE